MPGSTPASPTRVVASQDTPALQVTAALSNYGFEIALALVVLGGSAWLYLNDPLSKRQSA